MPTPTSKSSEDHTETPSSPYDYMPDLVDLDFSDTPPPSAQTSKFPMTPSPSSSTKSSPNTSGPWNAWAPMMPDVPSKAVTTPPVIVAQLESESDDDGDDEDEEATISVGKVVSRGTSSPQKSPGAGIEQLSHPDSPNKSEIDLASPTSISNHSETSSANLRAVATPFKSKSIRVAPSSAPHSFFPERESNISASLPSTPRVSQNPGLGLNSPFATSGRVFDEYAGEETSISLPELATTPSPELVDFQLPPIRTPVRITSPLDFTTDVGQNLPPTALNVPLPTSEPSSRKTAPQPSPKSMKRELDVSIQSLDEPSTLPESELVHSISEISLNEKADLTSPTMEVSNLDAGQDTSNSPHQQKTTSADVSLQAEPGMLLMLEEVGEMEKYWEEHKNAYYKFSGGIEEVFERLSHEITNHSCSVEGVGEELQALREQNLALHQQVRNYKDGKIGSTRLAQDLAHMTEKFANMTESHSAAEAATQKAQVREELWRSKYERSQERNQVLEEDRTHWHKREEKLAKSYIKIEDDLKRATEELGKKSSRMEEGDHLKQEEVQVPTVKFGAVLIECTATMVDEAFIKSGTDGGRDLGRNILSAIMPSGDGLVIAQLFLNFPDLKKKLITRGIIKKEADLHDFLDGFRAASGLFTVIDTESPGGKMEDHLKLYKVLGASKIIIASRRHQSYQDIVQSMADNQEVCAVRDGELNDPFAFLGDDRLVTIDGLMKPTINRVKSNEITPPLQTASLPPPAPTAASSTTLKRARDPAPHIRPPPSTVSDVSEASHNQRDDTTASPNSRISRPHATPAPRPKVAPWKVPVMVELPHPTHRAGSSTHAAASPGAAPATPWWEAGDTLNDKAKPSPSIASDRSYAASDMTSPPGTPRAFPQPDPEPTRHPRELALDRPINPRQSVTRAPGLTIPVDDMGSLAGSPPDSDEDHPNVNLPHSAMKWVQRPTVINEESDPSQVSYRSRSDSISSSSTGGPSRIGAKMHPSRMMLTQQGVTQKGSGTFRAPLMTGTNSVPVGQPRAAAGMGGTIGTGGKVHGFNVHGRK